MKVRVRSFVLVALVATALGACRKQPEPTPTPVVEPPPSTPTTTPVSNPTPPPRTGPTDAEIAAARADSIRRVEEARNTLRDPIYFDYDKADLRDDARAALEAKVPILRANPSVRIRIAGHTDERGSDEYNLALGQSRAAAAKRFLEARGIDGSRVDIVSFGEERPAQNGGDDTAWSRNRRDEFEITAGADNLRAPAR